MKQTNIVQYLLNESGLLQKDFAEKVGVNPSEISRYKNNPCAIPYCKALEWANKLNIKL